MTHMLLLLMGLWSGVAWGDMSFLRTQQEVAVTTVAAQALPNYTNRNYLLIVNLGPNPVTAKFGSAQTGSEGIPIPPSGNYETTVPMAEALYLQSSGGNSTAVVVEGRNR